MPAPVALQLYSVREQLAKDFEGVVRRVADMGYVGVEPAGFPGTTPDAAGRLFKDLGLQVPSCHSGMPVGPDANKSIDEVKAAGGRRLVTGLGPAQFKTPADIAASCELFNKAGAACKAAGLSLAIHNHWWEFQPVEGRLPFEIMLERLDPSIGFELDCYWIKTAGPDPAAIVKQAGKRAPLLHIKDGPAVMDQPMTAVGDGVVDYAAVVRAAAGNVEWMIVELDRCATDMLDAVKKSCAYLTSHGLAAGRT